MSRFGWCTPSFGVSRAAHANCQRVFRNKTSEVRCGCTDAGCECAAWNAANPIVQDADSDV